MAHFKLAFAESDPNCPTCPISIAGYISQCFPTFLQADTRHYLYVMSGWAVGHCLQPHDDQDTSHLGEMVDQCQTETQDQGPDPGS